MCHCSNLYHVYNNNYNNNYSFVILICLQTFCKLNLFVILLTGLFAILLTSFFVSSTLIRYIFTTKNCKSQLHTRLTKLLLTAACFVLPFNLSTSSVYRIFPKQKVHDLAFSRTLSLQFVYVHFRTCLSLILIVVGLFGKRSMYFVFASSCICLRCV